MTHLRELLRQIGLEVERVRMFNMSSAMAGGFVAAAQEMTDQINALGPSPLRDLEGDPAAPVKESEP